MLPTHYVFHQAQPIKTFTQKFLLVYTKKDCMLCRATFSFNMQLKAHSIISSTVSKTSIQAHHLHNL